MTQMLSIVTVILVRTMEPMWMTSTLSAAFAVMGSLETVVKQTLMILLEVKNVRMVEPVKMGSTFSLATAETASLETDVKQM